METIFNKKILNILLFILVLLLPFQTRYFLSVGTINNIFFEYKSISIYLLDIYILLFTIYLFFYNFKNKLFIFSSKRILFLTAIILFNLFLNLSLINSFDKTISVYFNLKIFLFSFFIFFLSFIKINLETIKSSFIISGAIEAFISILQFNNQFIGANKYFGVAEKFAFNFDASVLESSYGRFLRGYGLFPHPNILSLFLLIAFIFLLFKIININEKKNNKYLYCFFLGIIFLGIIFAFSRVAIFSAIFITIILLIYKIFNDFKNKTIKENILFYILIFLIELCIVFSLKELIFLRIDSNNRLNVISNSERENQYVESFEYIKNNSLIGVGSRNYTIHKYNDLLNNKKTNINSWDLKPVHNIYILFFSELGIFGFLSFLFLVFSPLLIKMENSFTIAYISILFFGFFDHFLITENFGIILLLLFIGIFFSRKKEIKAS